MLIARSKEWWMAKARTEPDVFIGAGIPDPAPSPPSRLMLAYLRLRAKFAVLWRIGLIRRGTAFRWEMDLFLGELS